MRPPLILLYFLLTGFIITGMFDMHNNFLLKTPNARFGIISLELFSPGNRQQAVLLNEWKHSSAYEIVYTKKNGVRPSKIEGLPTAISETHWDNFFILFYVGLITLLIYWGRKYYTAVVTYRTAIALIVIAGLCDYIENFFELRSMYIILADSKAVTGLAIFVFIPATVKASLLLFTLGYYYVRVLRPRQTKFLSNFNKWLGNFAAELWKFRIVVIGLLMLFVLLNYVPQGEDLVIMINSSPWGVFWFMLAILVLAILNWYLPKTYDEAHHHRNNYNFKSLYSKPQNYAPGPTKTIKLYLTRVIGAVTLLIPVTGILSALQTYHVGYILQVVPPLIVFLLVVFLYIESLRNHWLDKIFLRKNQFNEPLYWALFLAVSGFIALTLYTCHRDNTPSSLIWVAIALFALSFLFLVTVNYRQKFRTSLPFVPVLCTASIVVFLLFLLFNISGFSARMTESDRFYSLPIFIAGLVFYTLLTSYLLLLGIKYKWQFITILIVTGMVISSTTITGYHKVATFPIPKKATQDSLTVYIRKWLEARRPEIAAQNSRSKKYPVFFVNAYGGGIRAAAWTAIVVGRLNYLLRQDTTLHKNDFEHYTFSFSGASGGTIGLSLLAGARLKYTNAPWHDTVFSDSALAIQFFQHDFLTNDIVGILGRDFWAGSTGTNLWLDRAALTEKGWESFAHKKNVSYDTSFKFSWKDPKMEAPLLVSNTYDINNGTKGILAPVLLRSTDFPGVLMIQELVKMRDIKLSSAAFLSARFPYVSPTGKFDEDHHFTDGGTIENSGGETSLQLIKVFNSVVTQLTNDGKASDKIFGSIQINILSLNNSIPAFDSVKRVKNLYELNAPIAGILRTVDGNAAKADTTNHITANNNGWNYYIMPPRDTVIRKGDVHPILPLGWQISDYALEMMYATVTRPSSDLYTIKKMFGTNFKK